MKNEKEDYTISFFNPSPDTIHPPHQNEKEEEARQQKIIDNCLEILEKNEKEELDQNLETKKNQSTEQGEELNHQEDSENQQEEANNIPPPPEGIYNNLESLSAAIKEFAQAQGYAIVTKRTVAGKSAHFKCDRSAFFSYFSFHNIVFSSPHPMILTVSDLFLFLFFITFFGVSRQV